MSILDFFRRPKPAVSSVRAAATANSADTPENAHLWRRVGQQHDRNLLGYDHARMVEECALAARRDPLAKAHTRLVSSVTVGSEEIGPQIEDCEDDAARARLQGFVDDFWNDPENELGDDLTELMDTLTTTGSLALVAFTGSDEHGIGSHMTRVGMIDPASFAAPFVLSAPGNARALMAVLRRGRNPQEVFCHPILRSDDSVHPDVSGPVGSSVTFTRASAGSTHRVTYTIAEPCWYLGINRTTAGQTAGISDLYTAADLAGLHDALVFGSAERSVNFGAFGYQADFPEGTVESDVDSLTKKIARDLEDGTGKVIGTAGVDIKAIAPALQAMDFSAVELMVRKLVAIGLGPWPLHMLSDGTTTNVATAAEQGSPVANFLLRRQNKFRKLLVRMTTYAVRQRPGGRKLLEETGARIHFPLPVIVAKDTTRESNTLSTETAILSAGVSSDFITREAAARNYRDQANRYGLRFTPEDTPTDEDIADRAPAFTGLPFPGQEPDAEIEQDEDLEVKKRTEGTPERIAS